MSQAIIEDDDGRMWVVQSGGPFLSIGRDYQELRSSKGTICLPTNQLEGLTAEEIGQAVLDLIDHAHTAHAYEQARWLKDNGIKNTPVDVLLRVQRDIEGFLGCYDLIDYVHDEIGVELRKHNQRKDADPKVVRAEMRANYNFYYDQLTNRDDEECSVCGSVDNLEIDHDLPASRGGSNNIDNLHLLCRKCNNEKSDQTMEEWQPTNYQSTTQNDE